MTPVMTLRITEYRRHPNPYLLHLANAAFFAISTRLSGVSLAALALPPFSPPSLPRALKSRVGLGSICPVAS